MTISVVVVAHNEEKNIEKCLKSLQKQTLHPNEIVVVAHNCIDKTAEIAKKYSVKVVDFNGELGVVFARIKGFEEAQGEIIACIDGDSFASKNWLKKITRPLFNSAITGVGSFILLIGTTRRIRFSFEWFFLNFLNPKFIFYFWGASFACRKADYLKIGGFKPFIKLREKLNLDLWPEDLYLSLALRKLGKIKFVPNAVVFSPPKIINIKKDNEYKNETKDPQGDDRKKLFEYFGLK